MQTMPDSTHQPHTLPEVGCRVLEAPANGQVSLSGTSVGSQAFYSCNKGFLLVGDGVRVCKAEGEWSYQAPVCQGEWVRVRDSGPTRLQSVRVSGLGLGEWSYQAPVCQGEC